MHSLEWASSVLSYRSAMMAHPLQYHGTWSKFKSGASPSCLALPQPRTARRACRTGICITCASACMPWMDDSVDRAGWRASATLCADVQSEHEWRFWCDEVPSLPVSAPCAGYHVVCCIPRILPLLSPSPLPPAESRCSVFTLNRHGYRTLHCTALRCTALQSETTEPLPRQCRTRCEFSTPRRLARPARWVGGWVRQIITHSETDAGWRKLQPGVPLVGATVSHRPVSEFSALSPALWPCPRRPRGAWCQSGVVRARAM